MLIIPEMANPLASDSSSSSMDDIEGQYLMEQRELQQAAQRGLQDRPHQIQADSQPDDVIILSDEEEEMAGEIMVSWDSRYCTRIAHEKNRWVVYP